MYVLILWKTNMECMYFGGNLVYDVEKAYFKQVCMYIPLDNCS